MSRSFDPDSLTQRDPESIARILPLARTLNQHYLRLQVEGIEHLPRGPALYVGNHSGGIAGPDLCCTLGTLWDARGPHAPLYALTHDFAMRQLTALGAAIAPFGALRASAPNALRALDAGAQVLVYPGGDLDAYRPTRDRDKVVFGERAGFVRVARAAGVPIVPIVAQGAHRSAYILSDGACIARALRLSRWARVERFPVALALPWGLSFGPWLPYLPLPFRVRLRILPPMAADGVAECSVRDRVQAAMQAALNELAGRT